MMTLTDRLKSRLWAWYGTEQRTAEWDGRVYGGGKISQRYWEYFIVIEMLELSTGAVVLDIGGGSPALGLSMFPRLLAAAGIRVIVLDVNFGTLKQGDVENVTLLNGLADYATLSDAIKRFSPTHISCVSVLEHASAIQQRGIFDAMESAFTGERAAFTLEFHETERHFEQQLTTQTLSGAVSGLHRYYLDRIERSPMHCVDAVKAQMRLWYPLALGFVRTPAEMLQDGGDGPGW
jgi:hypothetical protein